MARGVVMQLQESTAVVMTDRAAFVEVPREPGMVVGAVIELSSALSADLSREDPPAHIPYPGVARSRHRSPFGPWGSAHGRRAWLGTAAACLVAVGILTVLQARQAWAMPYAYISVDVNPSVEFTVNRATSVLAVTPLDRDGARLMRSLSLDGLPLPAAVADYLRASDRAGFVGSRAAVVLTAAFAPTVARMERPVDLASLGENLKTQIRSTLTAAHVTVAALVVRSAALRAALTYHVSPGRLAVYLAAKSVGIKANWADMVDGRMAESVGGANTLAAVVRHLQKDPAVLRSLDDIAPAHPAAGGQPVGQLLQEASAQAAGPQTGLPTPAQQPAVPVPVAAPTGAGAGMHPATGGHPGKLRRQQHGHPGGDVQPKEMTVAGIPSVPSSVSAPVTSSVPVPGSSGQGPEASGAGPHGEETNGSGPPPDSGHSPVGPGVSPPGHSDGQDGHGGHERRRWGNAQQGNPDRSNPVQHGPPGARGQSGSAGHDRGKGHDKPGHHGGGDSHNQDGRGQNGSDRNGGGPPD